MPHGRVNFRIRRLAAAVVLALIGTALAAPAATAQPHRAEEAAGIIRANEEAAFDYFVAKGLTAARPPAWSATSTRSP